MSNITNDGLTRSGVKGLNALAAAVEVELFQQTHSMRKYV